MDPGLSRLRSPLVYLSWVFEDLLVFAHFLIAVNRVWAVVFPFSYRIHHNTKMALVLCSTTWIVLNICYIPSAIVSTVITPPVSDGTQQCTLNFAVIGLWSAISQVVLYDLPILLVILAYPIVCYNSFFANRSQLVTPQAVSGQHGRPSQLATVSKGVHASETLRTSH